MDDVAPLQTVHHTCGSSAPLLPYIYTCSPVSPCSMLWCYFWCELYLLLLLLSPSIVTSRHLEEFNKVGFSQTCQAKLFDYTVFLAWKVKSILKDYGGGAWFFHSSFFSPLLLLFISQYTPTLTAKSFSEGTRVSTDISYIYKWSQKSVCKCFPVFKMKGKRLASWVILDLLPVSNEKLLKSSSILSEQQPFPTSHAPVSQRTFSVSQQEQHITNDKNLSFLFRSPPVMLAVTSLSSLICYLQRSNRIIQKEVVFFFEENVIFI